MKYHERYGAEEEAINLILERDGWVKSGAITRRFGKEDPGWFWEKHPLEGTVSTLRVHGLVFVGRARFKGRRYKIFSIQVELREKLRELCGKQTELKVRHLLASSFSLKFNIVQAETSIGQGRKVVRGGVTVKKEEVSDELAAEIKRYREVEGLSVREVSEIMNLSMQNVTKIINSKVYREMDVNSVNQKMEVFEGEGQKLPEEKVLDQVSEWISEFYKSENFEDLSQVQKKHSGFIIQNFAKFMYSYYGLEPYEWHKREPGGGLEECCTQLFPRKVAADELCFESIAPVLKEFFSFAGDRGFTKNPQSLVERIQKIEEEIVEKATDSEEWGLGKSAIENAKKAGVDIRDEEELNEFLDPLSIQTRDSSKEKDQEGTEKNNK